MDKIELVVTHQTGGTVDPVRSAVFGIAGGTIGRAGQNKLVLPDADAAVARVHAMVRLDSDQAYIANLCERRAVLVDGTEVLSGQEVPLLPGAEIGIGPYVLKARAPGEPNSQSPARGTPQLDEAAARAVSQSLANSAPSVTQAPLDLASLPNPWADIPSIVGTEEYLSELAHLQTRGKPSSPVGLSSENPFAILGRARTEVDSAAPTHRQEPDTTEPSDSQRTDVRPEPAHMLENNGNPFESSPHLASPARQPQVPHRAMVIPDDFDPFAADPKAQLNARDSWSGDLPAQSLAEVAQLKHDELLLSLPQTSQFAGEMDDASHTGLPKQLDPRVELNPLKLFREPGESMYTEVADHGLSRGSDLAQVFSMPREKSSGPRPVPTAGADDDEPLAGSDAAQTAIAAGLQPTKGLDLGLFGGTGTGALPDLDLLGDTLPHATLAPEAAQEDGAAREDACEVRPKPAATLDKEVSNYSAKNLASTFPTGACEQTSHVPTPTTAVESIRAGAGAPTGIEAALAAAFLEGAGIAADRVKLSLTPEFMRGFGEALRVAVQGSIDLLSARTEIKREFRADVTIIASGANNPLKFLPTAEGVMLQLAGQTFPGFMKPVPAMKEAFNDLAVHQIALMAGIRAAYAEATARLSPAELEKNASASAGFLTRVSALHRKAALWDDYQQRYESIRRHAEDDLMAFSGKTFVEAYENAALAAGEKL